MNSFWRIFSLELIGLVRSKTLAMLMTVSIAWMCALPFFVKGDGTVEGLRELYIRYSLDGVFSFLAISLLASAAGSLARERAAKRLQLTLVRPVRYATIVLAKGLANLSVGALVLAIATLILAFKVDLSVKCNHVLKPVLPSPREEAKEMYENFMSDSDTPVEVKRAKKEVVLRLLENKAMDHYQTIPTNEVVKWTFPAQVEVSASSSVRMKFTNQFDTRDEVRGVFNLGDMTGIVSNITQAVLKIPLQSSTSTSTSTLNHLTFRNDGKNPLMLRPRKDIDLLIPADSFGANLVRAYLTLISILALLIAFGLFLSASLGRPVALFVAIVTLIVGEMSPSVVEQYPDELEKNHLDRIGLMMSRAVAEVTRPVATLSPLEKLSLDECVETSAMVRSLALNAVLLPVLLAILSGIILPRKQDDI